MQNDNDKSVDAVPPELRHLLHSDGHLYLNQISPEEREKLGLKDPEWTPPPQPQPGEPVVSCSYVLKGPGAARIGMSFRGRYDCQDDRDKLRALSMGLDLSPETGSPAFQYTEAEKQEIREQRATQTQYLGRESQPPPGFNVGWQNIDMMRDNLEKAGADPERIAGPCKAACGDCYTCRYIRLAIMDKEICSVVSTSDRETWRKKIIGHYFPLQFYEGAAPMDLKLPGKDVAAPLTPETGFGHQLAHIPRHQLVAFMHSIFGEEMDEREERMERAYRRKKDSAKKAKRASKLARKKEKDNKTKLNAVLQPFRFAFGEQDSLSCNTNSNNTTSNNNATEATSSTPSPPPTDRDSTDYCTL